MKKYNCHECTHEFQAETREDMLNLLYDHYIKDHNGVISNASEEEKKTWMARFDQDWAASPEF